MNARSEQHEKRTRSGPAQAERLLVRLIARLAARRSGSASHAENQQEHGREPQQDLTSQERAQSPGGAS